MAEQNIILQNILFSSGRWNLDFNAAGQDLGWVEIDGNYKLSEIANEIVNTGAGTNASHAIPSPIAHVKDFKTRLDNNDEDALNEWRGMLAVIALREARGYEVSISDKSLSKTDLGKVFLMRLRTILMLPAIQMEKTLLAIRIIMEIHMIQCLPSSP